MNGILKNKKIKQLLDSAFTTSLGVDFSSTYCTVLHCKIDAYKRPYAKPTEHRAPCILRKIQDHCIEIRRLATPGPLGAGH